MANILLELLRDMNVNKHDKLHFAINVCLLEGADSFQRLIDILPRAGFDRRHVALTLSKSTGTDPKRHHWYRNENGGYAAHPE